MSDTTRGKKGRWRNRGIITQTDYYVFSAVENQVIEGDPEIDPKTGYIPPLCVLWSLMLSFPSSLFHRSLCYYLYQPFLVLPLVLFS